MKALFNKTCTIVLAAFLFCIASAEAQVVNPQLKIKDYKLNHDLLLRIKQHQRTKHSFQNPGLKINPYWKEIYAPHVAGNSYISEVKVPASNAVWTKVDFDTALYNANSFLRSADAGKTWRYDTIDAPAGYGLSGISPIDASTCYAAMFNGDAGAGGGIFKTTDGGDTWKQLNAGKLYGETSFPDVVYFFDAQHGVTIGDDDGRDTSRPEIYTTSDAGKTWCRVPKQNIPAAQGYAFASNFNGYAVFENRLWFVGYDTDGDTYLYRSDDLGEHWQQFPYTLSTPFYSFAFADKQNGLGVSFDFGVEPHEVVTHDGGKTWTDKSFTGYLMGLNVTAIPFTHTFVSAIPYGYTPVSGTAYSNDYGATWKLIDSSSAFDHTTAAFFNPFIGWCGRADSPDPDPDGGIYKWKLPFSLDNTTAITDNAGSSYTNSIGAIKSNEIALSVSPNPVSNATVISFSLPQLQNFSIQIFDMNGRLVKRVANAKMEAGLHQFSWDARNESGNMVIAGTYLLKFLSDKHVETKMISVIR